MTKFHMNAHGEPARCKADKEECPLQREDGSVPPHFEGKLSDARKWAEDINAQDHSQLPSHIAAQAIEDRQAAREVFYGGYGYRAASVDAQMVSYEELKGEHHQKVAEWSEKIADAKERGDADQLFRYASELAEGEEYRDLMHSIEHHGQRSVLLSKRFSALNSQFSRSISQGRTVKDPQKVYEAAQDALSSHEEMKSLKVLQDDYHNLIADTLSSAYAHDDTPSRVYEFNGSTMGEMVKGEQHPDGSREWLELRQNGIGGSDIGAIVTSGQFQRKNLERIWDSKVLPVSDEELQANEVAGSQISDAISRGNALESVIGEMYARKNPDQRVMISKATWKDPRSSVQINFDCLLSDRKDGKPNGALEIKTSARPDDWGDESEGIDGVPRNYRAQVVTACERAGFSHGSVAVLINGHDYRSYEFRMTPALRAEARDNVVQADAFYERTQAAKSSGEYANPYAEGSSDASVYQKPPKDYSLSALNSGYESVEKRAVFERVAALRNTQMSVVKQEFIGAVEADEEPHSQEKVRRHLDALHADVSYEGAVYSGVDLETNSASPTKGRIIELGIVEKDMSSGADVGSHDVIYGVNEKSFLTNGSGPEHVHKISDDDIRGRTAFADAGVQDEVLEKLRRNRVMVAHNAGFEKKFLRAQLKGFAEAEARGDIRVVDTMELTKQTVREAPDNTMRSFTEHHDVEYVDAHRAHADAKMMMDALYRWAHR